MQTDIPDYHTAQIGTRQFHENNKEIDINEDIDNNINFDNSIDIKGQYNIIDLFWLIHPNRNNAIENEAKFVTISYNIDFGNIRINFYNIPGGAIDKNIVYLKSLKEIISATIYPSSCYRAAEVSVCEFTCIEQLITNTGEEWQKERPVTIIKKDEGYIRIIIIDRKTGNTYFYDFLEWQLELLIKAFRFTYQEGFILRGQKTVLKNLHNLK